MGMVLGRIDVETAAYEVLSSPSAEYEIRRYAAGLVAETSARPAAGGDSGAFRRLAKYIGVFGESENESKQPVAMTAPVISSDCGNGGGDDGALSALAKFGAWRRSSGGGGQGTTIAFAMPAEYTRETLPVPTSADVRIKELPERTVACVTLSGTVTYEAAAAKAAALEAMLLRDGLQLTAATAAEGGGAACEQQEGGVAGYTTGWTVHRFNPPWTLPFLKTNEVLVPIMPPSSAE